MKKQIGIVMIMIVLATLAWNVIRVPKQSVEPISKPSSQEGVSVQPDNKNISVILGNDKNPDFDLSIDPLVSNMGIYEDVPQNTATREAYLVAQITAHLNDEQLKKFRALRKRPKVRSHDGALYKPYESQNQCNADLSKCVDVIVNSKTNQAVWDGVWDKNFVETGVGKEVVLETVQ